MIRLSEKPFYLNEQQEKWVYQTVKIPVSRQVYHL